MAEPVSIIVIGASEGGVEALRAVATGLPAGFAAAVFVVLHVGAHRSQLPGLLSESGPLPASHPQNGETIRAGRIYVAPPDHHLVLELGRIRLTRGPRENWARPAIDPLFRSAASTYGPDVIGVILTGGLNDGTAGLYEVGQSGGVTVVQDPQGAANPSMPLSALKHVAVDHCEPLAAIPALLRRLVAERRTVADIQELTPARRGGMTADYRFDPPVAVTCPDCGGALRRIQTGPLPQFTCHIGHVYTAQVMAAAQFAALEWSLAAALRALSERREICRQMAEDARAGGDLGTAERWDVAHAEAGDRAETLRHLLEQEWTHASGAEAVAAA